MMSFIEWAVWTFLAPASLVVCMLSVGTILLFGSRAQWGRRIVVCAVAFVLLITLLPAEDWLLRPLERRFPVPDLSSIRVDGIIVLSGGIRASQSAYWGQPVLSESAERLTGFLGLARRHPEARLVVSDGGWDSSGQPLGAVTARQLFAALMHDTLRVEFEEKSKSTRDNAVFAKALSDPAAGERWVLVTSGFHMPRSVGAFRAVGWNVIPYPVDFRTGPGVSLGFQPAESLVEFSMGLREWIALVTYRILGYTRSVFPGPGTPDMEFSRLGMPPRN